MPPTFSVIIPTYNQADYLAVALNSVLSQTFQDFEVIVVNNHSTDHTLDVVEQLKDPRLNVINFKNNGVIGASRNVGIKASRARYVAFLDSDDTWHRNKLEKVAQVIEEDPQLGLVYHDQELIRDNRVIERSHYRPRRRFRGSMDEYLLFVGNGPTTSATVVARQYLDEVGCFSEDPDLVTVEDTDLWLKLSTACRFQFLSEVLGTFRLHEASASTNIEAHLGAVLKMLDRHWAGRGPSHQFNSTWSVRRQYAIVFYATARRFQLTGAFKNTLRYYGRALLTYPFLTKVYAGLALLFAERVLGPAIGSRTAKAFWRRSV